MFAGQECVFGSIRACVPLRHLHFYVRSPRPAPLLKFKLLYIYEEPTYPIWVSIFHFLRCKYAGKSGLPVWQHKGLCATCVFKAVTCAHTGLP